MANVRRTPAGNWRANWREPNGDQRSKTFKTKKEANVFVAKIEAAKSEGNYVNPHAGRMYFGELAARVMAARNDEPTTRARDNSLMKNHVLPRWAGWPFGKITFLDTQEWITDLCLILAPATISRCLQLFSMVVHVAVKQKLISANVAADVRVPPIQHRDTDAAVIERATFLSVLLPVVPSRHRAFVAMTAGTGMRWGEAIAVCDDVLDLERKVVRVVRTVTEVSGRTAFKGYPKGEASRREIPLPAWLVPILQEHLELYPRGRNGLIFPNEAGNPLRRTLFRSRVWRPALVDAGLLGKVVELGPKRFQGDWTDGDGEQHSQTFTTYRKAVKAVAKGAADGLHFHDLRHSYATWLVDDGVPVNMAQKVLGHAKASTTLDIYTRRTQNHERILKALEDFASGSES